MVNLYKLKEIRKSLEEDFMIYPIKCCLKAATKVNAILGYEIVEGVILCGDGPQNHVFNYDPISKNYIDISADQFPGFSSKILITPKEKNEIYIGTKFSKKIN